MKEINDVIVESVNDPMSSYERKLTLKQSYERLS